METHALPGSSMQELEKIIKTYGHLGKEADLGKASKMSGISTSQISRNAAFLVSVGVLSGGKKKGITEPGAKLSRALDHGQNGVVKSIWLSLVKENEFLSGIISSVRIKGGMTSEDISGHILYASGQKNTGTNRTGSRTILDILMTAGLLQNDDGKINVSKPPTVEEHQSSVDEHKEPKQETPTVPTQSNPNPSQIVNTQIPPMGASCPTIAINIELHLPATENPEVYDNLFKSLKKNLLTNDE